MPTSTAATAFLAPEAPPPRPGALRQAVQQARAALDGEAPDLVLVNDPQRATATPQVWAAARGLLDLSRARVLVAAGSHRFDAAARRAFESRLNVSGGEIAWHDARDARLVPLGGTDAPAVHPWLAEARIVLAIGSVEPHYFAGFTGAHKTLTIGCAAYADIERNHAAAMDPACRPCRPEASPVHAGIVRMLAAVVRERRVAVVNLMQTGETVVDAAGGEPLAALDALAPAVKRAYLRLIPRAAAALVVRVEGALGCSFYQAEKGIKNSEWAVRDGGAMVLVAACPEGVGQAAFTALLREAPTHAAAVARVRQRGYRLGDHKAVRLRYLTDPSCRGVRLFAVCKGLGGAEAALLGVRRAETVGEALAAAGHHPGDADVYHVEDAGNTCVEVAPFLQRGARPMPSEGDASPSGDSSL